MKTWSLSVLVATTFVIIATTDLVASANAAAKPKLASSAHIQRIDGNNLIVAKNSWRRDKRKTPALAELTRRNLDTGQTELVYSTKSAKFTSIAVNSGWIAARLTYASGRTTVVRFSPTGESATVFQPLASKYDCEETIEALTVDVDGSLAFFSSCNEREQEQTVTVVQASGATVDIPSAGPWYFDLLQLRAGRLLHANLGGAAVLDIATGVGRVVWENNVNDAWLAADGSVTVSSYGGEYEVGWTAIGSVAADGSATTSRMIKNRNYWLGDALQACGDRLVTIRTYGREAAHMDEEIPYFATLESGQYFLAPSSRLVLTDDHGVPMRSLGTLKGDVLRAVGCSATTLYASVERNHRMIIKRMPL